VALRFTLLRPDDLLYLQVEAVNLQLSRADEGAPHLRPQSRQRPAYLVFTFPPQTIAETAFFQTSPTPPPPDEQNKPYNKPANQPAPVVNLPPPGSVPARLGRPSRLVFRISEKARADGIPFTLAGLLDWSKLELVVSPLANIPASPTSEQRANAPGIEPPKDLETALELPYRLILSPTSQVLWDHAAGAVTHAGRTELWHTRLAHRAEEGGPRPTSRLDPATLRAIWSPDFKPNNPPTFQDLDPALGLTAMSPYDRHQIVILTSDFKNYIDDNFAAYVPEPVRATQLILSPLGGWLKSRGNWNPPFKWEPLIFQPPRWQRYFQGFTLGERAAAEAGEPEATEEAADAAPLDLAALTPEAANAFAPGAFTPVEFAALLNPSVGLYPGLLGRKGKQLDLSEWVHVGTLGRDHYVRIVYEGKLYKFGHRAALIKITERKFKEVNGTPAAYLIQRMYIVVREPVKDYGDPQKAQLENDGRGMPLKKVRLTTLITPDIDYPFSGPPSITAGSFWVMVGGADFKFHAVGEDLAGNPVEFTTPLIFVPNSEQAEAASHKKVRDTYNQSGTRRACHVPGQKMAFAPAAQNGGSETTAFATRTLYFETEASLSRFFSPRLFKAEVNIPAVEQMVGTQAATTIKLYDGYLKDGLVNAGGVFAQIVQETTENGFPKLIPDKLPVPFSADKAGGIATPNLDVTSLSRQYGPLAGDLLDAAKDEFDPAKFFPPGAAKLFGAFDLADLLKPLGLGKDSVDKNAPKLRVTTEDIPQGKKVIATLDWTPKVNDVDLGIVKFVPRRVNNDVVSKLEIKGRMEKPVTVPNPAAGEATFEMKGTLTDFDIDFLKIILIKFVSFDFKAAKGQKLDVSVKLDNDQPVKFQGDLEFVEELRKLIPSGALGNGPSLDINAARVKAGFAIALPPAAVGVFALKNIRFATFIELPFLSGQPLVDFAFAQRQEPFVLTIAFLGGGGFFHLQLDTEGIRLLEAAFEFGATAALDIGVASGSVFIMAGIYFKLEKKSSGNKESTLTGYLRMGGKLSVLGLVSVSVEFNLSFTYLPDKGKAYGRATLTVTIEILFFSTSVELSVERSFGRDGGDPTFDQLITGPDVWAEYAGAFA
jgi:hypothetical protein